MNSLIAKLCALMFFSAAISGCSGNAGNTNTTPSTNGSTTNSTLASDTVTDTEPGPYPQEVADEFQRSCQAAGSDAKYCKCVFEKVQERYSFEEFSVIDSELNAGTPPEEFIEFTGKARAECTK